MKKMIIKSIPVLIGCLLFSGISGRVAGQKNTGQYQTFEEFKAPKEVQKRAREYSKKGYYVAIGALSIERQLTEAWMRETEKDTLGSPKYIVASGQSVGQSQIAAKIQATEAAKLQLAGILETKMAALIENNIANAQLNKEEAVSVTNTVANSKSIIVQEIGRIIPLLELYKDIGKNIEANIRIAYKSDTALEMAKSVIRKQLEEELKLQKEKVDKLLNSTYKP
jgi:hypothetical protein